VIANAGVLLAGALVHYTDSNWPDLLIGAVLTVLVFRGGTEILRGVQRERVRLACF